MRSQKGHGFSYFKQEKGKEKGMLITLFSSVLFCFMKQTARIIQKANIFLKKNFKAYFRNSLSSLNRSKAVSVPILNMPQ